MEAGRRNALEGRSAAICVGGGENTGRNLSQYHRNGRIVFTCSKGLPGVGLTRTEWNEAKGRKLGSVSKTITDDTLPGGPRERTITYEAPFDRCDREEDYRIAWEAFRQRGVE